MSSNGDVNIVVGGMIFRCKKSALRHCSPYRIDLNGDFRACFIPKICGKSRSLCGCAWPHEITLEDLVKRILNLLENNRVIVNKIAPPTGTMLFEDSIAAKGMGLLPIYPTKWFY